MRNTLENQGWWKGKCSEHDLDEILIKISNHLGQPIGARRKTSVIEILKPQSADSAYKNSLSAQYELTAFPFHIDTAHWTIPCRYIVFGCKSPGTCGRKTLLIDWGSLQIKAPEVDLLKKAIFLVKDGGRSFYSSILSENEPFIRYDTGCMHTSDRESEMALQLLESILEKADKKEVAWEENDVLVMDNWRILHGRSDSNDALRINSSRELHRVLVK